MLNTAYRGSMDSAMLRVMGFNKMESVTAITLYSGCFISLEVIRKLALECPRLSFMQFENVDVLDVERLRIEMAGKNLDIKFCSLEMFDVW